MYYRFVVVFLLWLVLSLFPQVLNANESVVRIASASSMRFVLDDLLHDFKATGHKHNIQTVYGSSGNLYRQIIQGAPYDVFLSADSSLVDKLGRLPKFSVEAQLFGRGELMLYSSAIVPTEHLLATFESAIESGRFNKRRFKFAMANPAHAPYGKAAKQALQGLNLWEQSKDQRVVAEKVSQAMQFARSGAVEFALVSRTLTVSMQGTSTAVAKDLYQPVVHSVASLNGSTVAGQFLAYLNTDAALEILRRYGLR